MIVDGMALLFRSYFATAAMGNFFPNRDGVPTNGVQGFLRHMMAAKQTFQPTDLVVCWDMGAETFRNDLYDGYKAHRPAPAPELVPQFDQARQASETLGFTNLGVHGLEADDLIASLVENYAADVPITIVSGDKDLFQLLRPNVTIALTKKGYTEYDIYTEDRFVEEYGFTPKQYVDYKALIGDAADGYPGVKGIGPKTATRLIQSYGTIGGLIESLPNETKGVQKKVTEQREMLDISYELAALHYEPQVTLDGGAPIPPWSETMKAQLEALDYSLVVRYGESLHA